MDINTSLTTLRADRTYKYIVNSESASTKQTYATYWRDFNRFCNDNGYETLPARWEAVVEYLTLVADLGSKYSTIQGKVVAIKHYHAMAGHTSPTSTTEVKEILKGIRRTIGTATTGKSALTLDIIKSLLAVLPSNLRGIRDKAMILVCFGGAFRRSEIVGLDVEDVEFSKDEAVITLRRSKTDQEGRGQLKHLPRLRDQTICPVMALRNWLDKSGISAGSLFRPITWYGEIFDRHMNGQEVTRLVKEYMAKAGLDPTTFSGHSFRSGYVTEASNRDVDVLQIKQQTGHKSIAVLEGYIRDRGHGALRATRSAFGEG